ncbi:MAG TPA: hypothetical protein EYP35_10470 [Desulfobacterales bacterium]|nr:hypothetical protein [Desulfobacterales bacterium]HIP39245.1 hypothetical protein [Desulfocapsa sulfexigens]
MINVLISLIVIFSLAPSTSLAYDNKQTHPLLTEKAIEQSQNFLNVLQKQLGFEDAGKEMSNGEKVQSITEWLKVGSKEEDEPSCRAANHFHDPLKPWESS